MLIRVFLMLLICTPAFAADWPQWLGAKRDGNSTETIEPWKGELKPVWTAKVGPGFSSPVVAGEKVFVHARVFGKEREEVIAYEAKTGKELWRTPYDRSPYSSILNTGPQATPTVAGGKIYSYGITGTLSCLESDSGKIVWQVDTFKHFKVNLPRFGVCCSPVVIGNRVIVAVAGKGSAVAAFDTKSGDVAWQALDEAANTSSPIVYSAKGKAVPDIVFMTTLRVVGLNPLDGTVSWEYPLPFQPSGTAPTPMISGDRLFTSTMDNGTTCIQLKPGEKTTAEKLWQGKDLSGYFSSNVGGKDRLYVVKNVLKPVPQADLACVDLSTGKEIWTKPGIGYFHLGIIRTANDKLLILDDAGKLKMVDGLAKEYTELASAKICEGNLVCPSLANGYLYARDSGKIVCVKLGE